MIGTAIQLVRVSVLSWCRRINAAINAAKNTRRTGIYSGSYEGPIRSFVEAGEASGPVECLDPFVRNPSIAE
jgi:hypothetical protein